MKKNFTGEILVLISAVFWGCISLFSIPMGRLGYSSKTIVFGRVVIAGLALAVIMLIKDKSLFKIKLKDLPVFLGSALLGFMFLNLCYMTSIVENGSSVAAMLMDTCPLWSLLLSAIVFKEKITAVKIISLVGVLGGCVMVTLCGELHLTGIGLILGLCSGIGFALYGIFGKAAQQRGYDSLTVIFYTFFFVAICMAPFTGAETVRSSAANPKGLIYLAGAALLSTATPYILFTKGLQLISAGKAGILSVMELVVATVLGCIFYPDMNRLGAVGFIGIALVIASLVFMELPSIVNKQKEKEQT